MGKYLNAALLVLAATIVAVPLVASMDRSHPAINEHALASDGASTLLAYLIAFPPGSDLPEYGHLLLVGSVLIGLAAAVRKTV